MCRQAGGNGEAAAPGIERSRRHALLVVDTYLITPDFEAAANSAVEILPSLSASILVRSALYASTSPDARYRADAPVAAARIEPLVAAAEPVTVS